LCAEYGKRLSLTVDLREKGTWDRLQSALSGYRPGGTPLRLDLLTPTSRGSLEVNGPASVRSDAELISQLRALPGVLKVGLSWNRPW
jgi:DNA polymerase-3 subunit alpha